MDNSSIKIKNHQSTVGRRLGKRDITLLVIIFAILILVFVGFKLMHQETGAEVVIQVDGAEYGRYPLDQDAEVPITDDEGNETNLLVIKDGKADMTEADCPDQLCVHQKEISHQGETIVCLPNQIVVSVSGGEESEIDTVAQ